MKFGLLGAHLSHSYSPLLHKKLFELKGADATYELLEISNDQLENYINKIRTKEYFGFNVTIPYKKDVMNYVDVVDDVAKEIGAVNTVYLKDGLVHGTNTDYFGFLGELNYFNISLENKDCYVLGTGGASLAIKKAIETLNGRPIFVSRNPKEGQISYEALKDKNLDIIINTTPVGMYPNVNASPINKDVAEKANCIVDIIFNPSNTLLMTYNQNSYNGLMMLVLQGAKSEDIWLNKTHDIDYNKVYEDLRKEICHE